MMTLSSTMAPAATVQPVEMMECVHGAVNFAAFGDEAVDVFFDSLGR